jgi:ribosomal subunit interface protein
MDLLFKGRGGRITPQIRATAEHKLAGLGRMEPKLTRLELEVIHEKNPRQGGTHRVEASAATPRKVFRAHGDGPDVESALDLVVRRLERQIRDHHEKRRSRLARGRLAVRSPQPGAAHDAVDEGPDRDMGSARADAEAPRAGEW